MAVLIVFAHPLEAAPTIQALGAAAHEDHYTFDGGKIVITGLGALNAAIATARHPAHEVWNAGLAGSLTNIPIGTICAISSVSRHLSLPENIAPRSRQLTECAHPKVSLVGTHTLVTCDHGIQTKELCSQLSYDLVDMEGYGVARACQTTGSACRLVKIVSDHADSAASDNILIRLPALAEQLAEFLTQRLCCRSEPIVGGGFFVSD